MTNKDLEQAVTEVLPEGKEAYFFEPFLIWHFNGKCYGVLGGANQALAWQRGLSNKDREYFHLTNCNGERVTVLSPGAPGHAYAILDKINDR